MPIHLRADPGDYAAAVLCPGDPRRAAYIAATFFDAGWRQVNEERGMLGFTGTFDGRPISVQSTGMGCPSAGIVFEELIQLGATRLIRVGTCGGLPGRGLRLADTVIALSATCEDEEEPTPTCGDGTLDAGEQCDDGNNTSGDGCSSTCLIEVPEPVCGNGVVEAGEECDDGNSDNSDTCTTTCRIIT